MTTTIKDLGERFGGLGTTEAQKQGLAAYAELAKLIGEDKFDKEAREAEIHRHYIDNGIMTVSYTHLTLPTKA